MGVALCFALRTGLVDWLCCYCHLWLVCGLFDQFAFGWFWWFEYCLWAFALWLIVVAMRCVFLFCLVVVSACGLIANVCLVFDFGGGV